MGRWLHANSRTAAALCFLRHDLWVGMGLKVCGSLGGAPATPCVAVEVLGLALAAAAAGPPRTI